jgi:large subunit ribosomal protein L30e
MNLTKSIRTAVDAGHVILGTKKTLDAVLTGDVKFVAVASNCDRNSREDLDRYSKLSGTQVHEFNGSSVELGEVCGKPFIVSMLAVFDSEESSAPKPKRKKDGRNKADRG